MPRAVESNPPRPSFVAALVEAARHIVLVMGVGAVLSTIFTIWTPNAVLPADVLAQIETAILRVNTEAAPLGPTPLPPTATPALPKIGIVAGHNGPQNDPGTVCPDGLTEAAVNLDIATRVKAGLEANGFYVDLLDEFDQRLNGYQALAVVSIHNDSCAFIDADPPPSGFKVAGAINGGAPERSKRLVACLIDRYPEQTNLRHDVGRVTLDMTQYHTYSEVDASTPVAIIETGYLNLDRKLLTEEPYRAAQGVMDGLLCYVRNEFVSPTAQP
jgi:N-acetylmuramoyl-L-alanine amidase